MPPRYPVVKPNTAKAKGRETETWAVDWLRERLGWLHAERRRLNGPQDRGDTTGHPGVTVEVKSAAAWRPVEWQRQLRAEMDNNTDRIGFVMARPRGVAGNVDEWVMLVPPEVLARLLADAGWCPIPEMVAKP